jgi:tetratricopeptide (TPR) repeat protein
VRLTEREVSTIRKVPTHSIRAYENYLRGRQLIYRFRRQSFAQARDLFERAIEIDPSYALAWAGVADCCSFLYMYWEHTDENLQEADSASRTALEHDPELAEAHAARGLALSLSKNFEEAEAELQRAIDLDPTLFEAYYFYARACWAQGKLELAAKMFEDANRARPEDYQSLTLLSNVYHAQGRLDDEKEASRRALEIIRRHLELYPDDVRARYMGAGALIMNGEREEGRAWLEQSLETDDPSVYYNVACGFMGLGERERALDCLSRAVDAGFAHREWAENDAELAPLKGDARFTAILARMA